MRAKRPVTGWNVGLRRGGGLLALALAALAIVFVPAGSAKPTPPPSGTYQVCLTAGSGAATCTPTAAGGDYSVLSGLNPELQVTITNDSTSNQLLDFANVNVPAGINVTIDTGHTPQPASYTAHVSTSASSTSTLGLRNLGLTPGHSVTVAFFVNSTHATCTDGNWSTLAQSAANGSFFTFPSPTVTSGLTSLVAKSCTLAFQHEPTAALKNTVITSQAYTPVGGTVHNVTVVPQDAGGQALPVALNGGNVALAASSAFDPGNTGEFPASTTNTPFSSGSAAFVGLKATGTGGPFTLTASAPGFDVDPASPFVSSPFVITQEGTGCNSASCTLTGKDKQGNALTSITTNGGFSFVGTSPSDVPLDPTNPEGLYPTGCQSWLPTDNVSGFVEFDGRSDAGTMAITYYVSQSALKARYGKNVGNQFIPICFGAKPVDPITHQAVDCTTPGYTPWTGDKIDSNRAFTGKTQAAVCGPGGYYWGIISSYQDKLDQTANPVVTGWGGPTSIGQNYRAFVISEPAGWDGRGGC